MSCRVAPGLVFTAERMVTMRRTALVIGLLLSAVAATASLVVAQSTAGNPSDVAADSTTTGSPTWRSGFLARRSGVPRTTSLGW
jgi:hypothetical protein